MTKTKSSMMHPGNQYPANTMVNNTDGFGPIGRPIYKTLPHPPGINVNSHQGTVDLSAQQNGEYRLFGSQVPFEHYHQPRYDGYLHPQVQPISGQPSALDVGYSSPLSYGDMTELPLQDNWTTNSIWEQNLSSPTASNLRTDTLTSPTSPNTLASALSTMQLSPPPTSPTYPPESIGGDTIAEDVFSTDSEDEENNGSATHPNKYPVEIEDHGNQQCGYRRQPTRSGPKMKHQTTPVYDAVSGQHRPQTQRIKYYQKHLVRICRCGKYSQMDGALVHGRSNDCDGYEIHYSAKCKWKAYDDFKTGKRVLIRLCKCYKPF